MYNSLVFLFTHLECSFCLLLIILLLILPIVCIFNTISSSHVFEVNISGSWYFEMSSLEIFVLALKSRLHVCLGRSGFSWVEKITWRGPGLPEIQMYPGAPCSTIVSLGLAMLQPASVITIKRWVCDLPLYESPSF